MILRGPAGCSLPAPGVACPRVPDKVAPAAAVGCPLPMVAAFYCIAPRWSFRSARALARPPYGEAQTAIWAARWAKLPDAARRLLLS